MQISSITLLRQHIVGHILGFYLFPLQNVTGLEPEMKFPVFPSLLLT